jgi:hypothetical protein
MEKCRYVNRYNDEFLFEQTEKGISWKGKFEWSRFGWPNVYDIAYEKYIADGNPEMDAKSFKAEIFENENLKQYQKHVYSNKDVIDMVDPSGGPYLTAGMYASDICKCFTGTIKEFKRNEEGYLIILE